MDDRDPASAPRRAAAGVLALTERRGFANVASISLTNVSVQIPIYDIGGASLRKAIIGKTIGGRFAQSGSHVMIDALRDISLDAHDGNRIALIGNNGSGKSTLLRVLSDVYPPTSGTIQVAGDVTPMFDATLGMTMDATGMENIWVCGRIWGLSPAQIKNSIDDISDFTELGDYLNVPVRTYSTGMMLRLAFAIATVRDPEIFLLDEIIGVGDAAFFEKAFNRLQGVIRRSRILFLASHADDILRKICDKAIWLDHGRLIQYGDFETVVAAYRSEGNLSAMTIKAPDLPV
jgi:ABC-type polysaccharide/polyol phosphate transport system ATPase subunit